MSGKDASRKDKTLAYFKHRDAFLAVLVFEIAAHVRKAEKLGMTAGVRLNATSDLPWETRVVAIDGEYVRIMDYFAEVEFYDYTKVTKRAIAWAEGRMPANYHLTFSRSEDNEDAVEQVLRAGGNVTVVMSRPVYKAVLADGFYRGVPVVDGDEHDFRPADGKGVVVVLKAKGDAIGDTSGFTITDYYGHALAA
jgi:hypothetical protein